MDLIDARWRKSSYSGGNAESCVEVAVLTDRQVAVRDSKDRSLPVQVFTATGWAAFVDGVRRGEFNLANP